MDVRGTDHIFVDYELGFKEINTESIIGRIPESIRGDEEDFLIEISLDNEVGQIVEDKKRYSHLKRGRIMLNGYGIRQDISPNHLIESVETSDLSPSQFLTLLGVYISSVYVSTRDHEKVINKEDAVNIVSSEMRSDLLVFFSKAEEIYKELDEDKQEDFINGILRNFKNSNTNDLSNNLLRNATFNVAINPPSILDPASVMTMRLIKEAIGGNANSPAGFNRKAFSYALDPKNYISNPEFIFLIERAHQLKFAKRDITHEDILDMATGVVDAMFRCLRSSAEVGSYEHNVAKAYFVMADIAFEQSGIINNDKPSEGGFTKLPVALTELAGAVSRSNKEAKKFSSYGEAFDYILPTLDLSSIWPDLDDKTIDTIKAALLNIAHKV